MLHDRLNDRLVDLGHDRKSDLDLDQFRLRSRSARLNVVKTFKAPTQEEAHAKADAWLEFQTGLKNVARRAYIFRAAFPIDASDEGLWTVAVHYEQDS